MLRLLTIICSLLFSFTAHANTEKLKVVASFSILGDIVQQIGGDAIDLHVLAKANSDAHVFEPTPYDAKTLAAAEIVVINGLGFEGWIERLVLASGYKGQIVTASKGVNTIAPEEEHHGHEEHDDHGSVDPHAWHNVANVKTYVANIRDALAKHDPTNTVHYNARARAYLLQLESLDTWIKSEIAKVPQAKRKIITTHDSFQYYASAYGISFIAPLGVTTDSEASAADIAKLIDQLRNRQIQAVFFENTSDGRIVRQLQTDAKAHIGGTLYSDALSKNDGPAASYLALMRHNTAQLVAGMLYNPMLHKH
jgi:zinc/manganese transport system substrate-binding protein